MRTVKDGVIAFGLLITLGVNALAGPMVVCTGNGGHVAVEPAFVGCCSSTPSGVPSRPEGSIGTSVAGCGFCQDTPIPVSPSYAPTPRTDQDGQLPPATVSGLLLACPDLHPALSPWGALPLPLRGSLSNLRTTILRL